eukprot:4798232-Pyramimonas_sp.AAC.1
MSEGGLPPRAWKSTRAAPGMSEGSLLPRAWEGGRNAVPRLPRLFLRPRMPPRLLEARGPSR